MIMAALAALLVLAHAKRPHILVIVADDLGWNDVSFHGSKQIPTPHLDELASNGVVLNRYHVNPVCSPTRTSLFSGRATVSTGVYLPLAPAAAKVGLNGTCNAAEDGHCVLLGEAMSRLGYEHRQMIGKWHCGMWTWEWTPLGSNNFPSYTGYLGGAEDYFQHTRGAGRESGYDMWRNETPWTEVRGRYSTEVFAELAVDAIRSHAPGGGWGPDRPLFLVLTWQAMHSPLQAPQQYIDRFSKSISDVRRRTVAGMVSAMDDGIGNITAALRESGMLNDTLIFFTSDNGGPADGFNSNMASNIPLLGRKHTLWEGGHRVPALVSGAGISASQRGTFSDELMHVSDLYFAVQSAAAEGINGSEASSPESVRHMRWLETLRGGRSGAAPGDVPFDPEQDGHDVWPTISRGVPSPRTEIIHYASPVNRSKLTGAVTVWPWKLVQAEAGNDFTGYFDGNEWLPTPGQSYNASYYTVKCPPPPATAGCDPTKGPCLFNLQTDPCEHTDRSKDEPAQLAQLQARLRHFQTKSSPDHSQGPVDEDCLPDTKEHAGSWYPCEEKAEAGR